MSHLFWIFLQYNLDYCLNFSKISLIFLFILLLIVSSIKYFSYYYMDTDNSNYMYFIIYYIFVLSMVLLIFSNSWFLSLYAWDGLGISSYLLIVFYYSVSSTNSGFVTMIINRLGDIFLMIFLVSLIFYSDFHFSMKFLTFSFFLLVCVFTKSAQFPFTSWLPLAMAAPTPISSLVHSSTLVTSGIYLFFRNDHIFNNNFMICIFFLSLWTSFFSGFMAFLETDLKKLIALSTLSQLSFIFLSMSLGLFFLSFFHLLVHASFKSSLFFSMGTLMHNIKSDQFSFSVKKSANKFNSSMFFLIFFSLVGFPFSIGFYSKDQIMDIFVNMKFWIFFLFFSCIFFTFSYSFRFFKILIFYNNSNFFFKNFYTHNIYTIFSFSLFFFMILILLKLILENFFKLNFLIVSFGWKFIFLTIFFLSFYFLIFNLKMNLFFSKMIFLLMFFGQMFLLYFKKKNILLINDYGWLSNFLEKKIYFLYTFNNFLNSLKNFYWFFFFFFFSLNFFLYF